MESRRFSKFYSLLLVSVLLTSRHYYILKCLFVLYSGLRSQSFLNSSIQSTHTIEDTGSHSVESFGAPLPVLVNEALTLAESKL